MSDEGFLRRWSRLKTEGPLPDDTAVAERQPVEAPAVEPAEQALPTLDDVARLDANSDFSAFVTRGVDKDVRRLAMKKLFSDPHFNLMDGLDIYISDYNKPDPIPAAMLAALHHTRNLFAPLASEAAKDEEAVTPLEASETSPQSSDGADPGAIPQQIEQGEA